MKIQICFGRACLRSFPRADGPGGKIRVIRKDTGKTTFVAPKTLEDHPERYEAPRQKMRDKTQEKQKRRELARQEQQKREKPDAPQPQELTPKERKQRIEELKQKRQERKTKEEEGRERSRIKQQRQDTWNQIKDDHPELSPEEQKEREKTFLETGLDSGGRSTKALRWWLQHHSGMDPATGIPRGDPPESKKLDRKTIQEHFKYGPKPTKKGKCPGLLKSVTVGTLTICVDPNTYDIPQK